MVELRRLLIANRGEIAVRIVRACREAGIEAVVAVTSAEVGGLPATIADGTVEVASYLDADALVAAAVACGADSVHPGYGFLAEDPAFAELVLDAGLTWIGPPPDAMRRLGDKLSARAVADAAGVPVIPSVVLDGLAPEAVEAEAARIGAPLLVKASAGGGGRGMRPVDDLTDLATAVEVARTEAASSFGDGRVFLERRLVGVRHVEVQLLIDQHGGAVHLGERDCSLQRRHQKIVEESPSPAVGDELRARLGEAAIAVAEAAGYRGAGTAEFLLDRDGGWWFLEMNARLQVEHPVTEAVTGVDIVRAQLAIAAGRPLELDRSRASESPPPLRGHAIEARVYAEDPANGFLPAGGRVERLDLPRWPGVRIDTALVEGEEVGLGFDPLLAKVVAWGEDRPSALTRLRAALAEVRIVGVTTNLGFLLDLLGTPAVRDGTTDTTWVETSWVPDVPALPPGVHAAHDPWSPWFAFGPQRPDDGVTVAGEHAQYRGWAYRLEDEEPAALQAAAAGGSLVAPMPASVVRVDVGPGESVAAGQVLAVLEAMKIQVQVTAPVAGTVRAVHVEAGDVVARGRHLIELEEP